MDARWSAEGFMRANLHRETGPGPKRKDGKPCLPPAFSIAISRQIGAGGSEIAREVGRRLGWKVYDRELLEEIARDMHVRVSLIEAVDERHVNWLEEFAEAFLFGSKVSENSYVVHLVETIINLAARGQCVIVGRGGCHILPPSCTLRVRIVAPRDDRVTSICHERHADPKSIEHELAADERQQARFIKDHFQRDVTDPANYDLVLNSSRWSTAECADMIVDALRELESRRALSAAPAAASTVSISQTA
ncbi:MAG TPA: cytidylate kinase-like family protein [Pirellulales bacterium]|nr:cytidylate kinase-like family protein [Pirellulales bacterium]